MTTSNITITPAWTQLASTTDAELLGTWHTPVVLEVATTTANSAPTVDGHRLTRDDQITRSVMGSGYVWAKVMPGNIPSSITMVVSK